jgi:multicomponent Na+:H+ antiporter subunit E
MRHTGSLLAMLVALWLGMSGQHTPLLLALGAVSCALVMWVARRMRIIDAESQPVHMMAKLPAYWFWLVGRIAVSNVAVLRTMLDPRLPISPTLTRSPAGEITQSGRAILANSITLTPGTLSVHVHADGIDVHALTREGADKVAAGAMDRRVSRMER